MNKISKFLKEQRPAFYILCGAALLTIVALVFGAVSCSAPGYYFDEFNMVIFLSLVVVVITAAAVCIPIFFKEKKGYNWMMILQTILFIGSIALSIYCIMIMFHGKLQLMGNLWFSELERGKAIPEFALNMGVVSMIFFLLASVALAVGSFFNPLKIKNN